MTETITLTQEQLDAMADHVPSPEAMKNLYAAADRYREHGVKDAVPFALVTPRSPGKSTTEFLDLFILSAKKGPKDPMLGRGLTTPIQYVCEEPGGYWFWVRNKGKRRFGKCYRPKCYFYARTSAW
jgi:hypothetical protein